MKPSNCDRIRRELVEAKALVDQLKRTATALEIQVFELIEAASKEARRKMDIADAVMIGLALFIGCFAVMSGIALAIHLFDELKWTR